MRRTAFRREQGLSLSSLYQWKSRLKVSLSLKAGVPEPSKPEGLVEVRLPALAQIRTSSLTLRVGDHYALEFVEGFSESLLLKT